MSDINSRQSSEVIESKHNAFTGSDKEPLRKAAYLVPAPSLFPLWGKQRTAKSCMCP